MTACAHGWAMWAESAIKKEPQRHDHAWLYENIYRSRFGERHPASHLIAEDAKVVSIDPKQKRPARKRGAHNADRKAYSTKTMVFDALHAMRAIQNKTATLPRAC
jgi:hypothetical protein